LSWEFFSADEIAARGLRAMRNHVRHVKECSPYYQEVLRDINPDDIKGIEDIQRLPFTDKKTVTTQTERFLGTSKENVVETVITSGSTGAPLVFCMTASDLDRLAYNEALSFFGAGVTAADVAHVMVSLDRMFIAGMAYYRGLTLLGANTSRVGIVPAEMKKHYLELLKPTVIVCVPSYMRKLGLELNTLGFNTRDCSIKRIFCIGESIRDQSMQLNALGKNLEEMFRAQVFSTYASTEISVAYCECSAQQGGHAHPELIYTEIVDEKGNPVPDGTPGELIATPLGVEGTPLLRYRTGDITIKMSEPCSCGRNSLRIGPILARRSQTLKVKGTTIFPLTVTNALDEFDEIQDYVILLEGDASTLSDQVTIHAAVTPDMVPAIVESIRAHARVSLPVLVSNVKTIQMLRGGDSRKKLRVIDKRYGHRA
jgi:phenylacetate-CoA ligase